MGMSNEEIASFAEFIVEKTGEKYGMRVSDDRMVMEVIDPDFNSIAIFTNLDSFCAFVESIVEAKK